MRFLPKHFDLLEDFIAPDLYTPITRNSLAIEFKQQRYKMIQEAKRTWLNIFIRVHETKYRDYEDQYQRQLKQIALDSSTRAHLTTYINHRTHRVQQEIFSEKIPVYRRKLTHLRRQRLKSNRKTVNVAPSVILDINRHPFTHREIAYLSRGPNYIRPNQSTLRPRNQREKQVDQEATDYMKKLMRCMVNMKDRPKIPTTASIYKSYEDRLRADLLVRYLAPLPLIDQLRARRELKIVKSIRQKLKKYRLLLRQTDKSGVLHIGHVKDYERKAAEYRQKTGAYEELTSNPFADIFNRVIQLLNNLRSADKIKENQKTKMMPIRAKTELAYMYFLPKTHKVMTYTFDFGRILCFFSILKKGTPLRPIINTIHAATTAISKYLDKLIRPLFDKHVRETTIVGGVDLLDKLQKYTAKGYLTSSTLLITFDITNLYTMLPQEESLKILGEFLREYHCEKANGISIETLVELGRIVLEANAFVYGKKFYRQIIGGAMGSAFTLTLANIFMWKWEKKTMLSKLPSYELYGR
ncbi:unnamed protein product [Rotaria sp. Silwood2]|nr:unnamed protein product [Rotaria sp. Silwood2]CAF2936122.1 unnamed protein product [Rotaria sp. Silwood2]CAF3314308.1 unnamed protein product [Rotaria sp. Silwood2]CAF3903130.1 unnamed protein product [Rotaria sp. Silwood2]CAF3989844.1 unnamed protein product [Rotaria sp. Silwood2]